MTTLQNFDPSTAENNEDIEKQFSVKAVLHLETYWNLLNNIPGSKLKLTKYDSEIYTKLLEHFPEFADPKTCSSISEEEMKSKAGKEKWRNFCEEFKFIEDYNFGTLLRTKSNEEYTEHGTIFVVRIQFYAIEICRNKYGLNDWVYEQNKK